ncbi:Zn-dependent protease with chaperone function [Krasilnikovia cinnamomea]|uniref:Zn-dependent protease with chaperone function n=1 Tax=Krasilnikovia cinnamomea TaxID=349313 RepID=A0A4Q7ZNZ4_9ACTN|nr:M48 family metallopeptidase [Krasilnikovia cinnamomea]RZU52424.1 Zn-dependent protease with chaperone function [Krasilnikovia cinnamomea]
MNGHGVRAMTSAVALAGFLAVAVAQLAFVAVLVLLLLAMLPGALAARVGAPLCMATVGVLAYATWQALRARHAQPTGVPVSRADAPHLWELVDAAARAAGTRAPDTVTVVAEAAATLRERSRLLGLIGGRRDLYLGLPLLQAWDVPRLRAVVAHELAHFSGRDARLAPLAYRGRVAVGRGIPRIRRGNPAGPVLRAYARLYRRLDAPFSRAQEFAADRVAAEFAGTAATAAVLTDLPTLDALQRLFRAEYVAPGWQAGHTPDDLFGGFLRMLAARADEAARLRARPLPDPGPWDTHPPRAERLAALPAVPEPPPGPAAEPVPDLPGLGRALQAVAYPPQGRTAVDWDTFFGAARTSEMEREAGAALATISRAAGTPVTSAADVLDLAADGRLRKVAESVLPDLPADEAAAREVELVTLLLALAALRSGVARWRHNWTGTAELVTLDGGHLDLSGPAALVADPATVAEARDRLAALGVDPAATGDRSADGRAEVVGGVVNLVVDGARTDVLIVDTGLFLVPGLPRAHNGSAKRRLARFAAADAGEREAAAPGGRFVPYTEVAGAARTRRAPRAWDLRLRDGATLSVRAALDSDELPGGWAALDDAVAFLARTRATSDSG